MSRAREAVKLAFSSTITLPNIPRIAADEKSRQKYHSEYDKYEPELRRHHLGAAETTKTIGLKDVPAEFDRTVPSPLGPTEAEMEYGRICEKRKAQRQRKGARTAGVRLAPTMKSPRLTPMPRNLTLPRPPQSAAIEDEPQQRGSLSASFRSSASGTHATSATAAPVPPAVSEEPTGPTTVEVDGTHTVGADVVVTTLAHTPQPPPALTRQKSATVTTPTSQLRARTAPPRKRSQSAKSLGQRSGRSCTPLNGVTEPKPRHPSPAVGAVLSSTAPPPTPLRPSSAFRVHGPPTAESTARLLRVLLDPPQKYVSSLRLDVSSFDLKWLRNGQSAPHQMVTISSYFNDDAASRQSRINSPRSVITLLENGVLPQDWNPKSYAAPAATMSAFGDIEQEASSLQSEICAHRRAHVQAKRDAIRRALQDSYSSLCAQVPLNELVSWYRDLRQDDTLPNAALETEELTLETVAQQRPVRQRWVLEGNKPPMARELQLIKKFQGRQEATAQRKLHEGVEVDVWRRNKMQAEQESRQPQQIRLEAHLVERQRREEEYQRELQSRLEKAEARNAERAVAREKQLRKLQQQREAQEAERVRRLERNMAAQEEQAAALEKKRREKEAKIEQLRAMREARLEEDHRRLVEKQQQVAYLRDLAKRRAAEAEEAARQAALERQLQVEERLRELQARRREEAVQRMVAEIAHHEHLNEIRSQALAREEMLKATVEGKNRQNEEHYRTARLRQLADIMWRREAHWEEEEAKAYAVLQLQRIVEFRKLYTVAQLLEKRKAAEAVVRQRELMHEQAMRSRDELRAQRDLLTERIATLPQKTWR
ncbi:hypothetical protein JKF63_00336 [Porcisia hertigi]|uniref:Uncharacterized protein n=1 Tax=Porcisia hertigi TaxID=2761500 RepID=A0A836HPT2_9TRYP|nr:hypothetical protein JKF63_00336 [Porcisia hertigi]